MIGILATGGGNIQSLSNALEYIGLEFDFVSEEQALETFSAVIIPGVGHFQTAMKNLERNNYSEQLHEFHSKGKIIVGICLGFQLLFEASDEAPGYTGLSLLKGHSGAFKLTKDVANMNVGWSNIFFSNPQSRFEPFRDKKFYFMHCYRVANQRNDDNTAWSKFSEDEFLSVIWQDNIRAFQFHPEKSGIPGLNFLKSALVD